MQTSNCWECPRCTKMISRLYNTKSDNAEHTDNTNKNKISCRPTNKKVNSKMRPDISIMIK